MDRFTNPDSVKRMNPYQLSDCQSIWGTQIDLNCNFVHLSANKRLCPQYTTHSSIKPFSEITNGTLVKLANNAIKRPFFISRHSTSYSAKNPRVKANLNDTPGIGGEHEKMILSGYHHLLSFHDSLPPLCVDTNLLFQNPRWKTPKILLHALSLIHFMNSTLCHHMPHLPQTLCNEISKKPTSAALEPGPIQFSRQATRGKGSKKAPAQISKATTNKLTNIHTL